MLERIDCLKANLVVPILQRLPQQRRIAPIAELGERLDGFPAHQLVGVSARVDQRITTHIRREAILERIHSLQANIFIPIA